MAEQEMEFCKNCKIPKELCPKVCNIETIEVERKVLPEGTILHQDYQIYGTIGAGGMSVTYCACTRLKPVLLKQFNLTSGNREALDVEKEREKFGEEARKLLTLNHPNIVRIENIVTDEKTKDVFLVMELLYGETLEKYLQGLQEPMPEQEAYQMLAPIFDALETVHQAGIIHRDIKPSNIMLCIDGTIKLIDFGSARQEDNYTKTALLTEGYAPPEQYEEHGNQGTWTDVYSMCATLYRMVTGKKPPASWSRYRKDTIEIPEGLKHREELKKGLALEVEDRWQTMKELRAALGIASLPENAKYAAKKSLKKVAKVAGDKIAEGFAFDVYEPEREQETQRVQIDESKSRETEYMRQETRRAETNKNKGKTAESVQADISEDDENDLTAEEMYQLGENYYYGKGVLVDEEKAVYWYKKAAEAGNADGMYSLGYVYQFGIGIEKNDREAFYWYEKAAEAGNADGMRSLSDCYDYGIGTEKDEKEAIYWQKRANGYVPPETQTLKIDESWNQETEYIQPIETDESGRTVVETKTEKESEHKNLFQRIFGL